MLLSAYEEDNVFHVRGVGEHVDGLDGGDTVVHVQVVQVAGLGGRIARDVDNALGGSSEDGLYHIGVHTGTGRVGDDDVGTSVLSDEIVGEDVLHVAGKKECVVDAVDLGVDLRILNSLGYIFYTDDFAGLAGHEIGDGAGAGVEVVDDFPAPQPRKLAGD